MRITVDDVRALTFDDGAPVTAASAIAPLGEGWLVASDDSTIAAWVRPGGVTPLRVLPPVEGLDHVSGPTGTEHLEPDLKVACPAEVAGEPAVLLLGSGSTPRRMRGVLVRLEDGEPVVRAGELGPLYAAVGRLLQVPAEQMNLEGASRQGDTVRWFHRGNLAAGAGPASVDVPLADLVAAVLGSLGAAEVPVSARRSYDLGQVAGVGLAVTDAIALPDGRELLSAATEDTPDAAGDGPAVAAALALVDGGTVLDIAAVPAVDGRVHKVEGLALRGVEDARAHVLAVAEADDPGASSVQLELRVDFS